MPDLLIHRCRVRVLRRDGWSWGPAPRELVQDIIDWLAQTLQKELAAMSLGEANVEITEPVRITIPARLDLHGRLVIDHDGPRSAIEIIRSAPAARTETGQEDAPSRHRQGEARPIHADIAKSTGVGANEDAVHPSALVRLLLRWRERGCLGLMLRKMSPAALQAFHDALVPSRPPSVASSPEDKSSSLREAVRESLAHFGTMPAEIGARRLARLVLAVEVGLAQRVEIDAPALWHAIDDALPLVPDQRAEPGKRAQAASEPIAATTPRRVDPVNAALPMEAATSGGDALTRTQATARRSERSTQPMSQPGTWETQVSSVLPFLLLGPLSDSGFFASAEAALEVEELGDAWPTFAAALAYKVLDVPDRFGRRTANARHGAAVFAGCAEPIPEEHVTDLAGRTHGKLSVVEAVIAHALLTGHPAGRPVSLHAVDSASGGGWLLMEPDGSFPIAWAEQGEGLLSWLDLVESELVLVPRSASEPRLLRRMHERGIRFLTDAPPTHGETWRSVRRKHMRWWTNDGASPASALVRHAQQLEAADASAATVWQTLRTARLAAVLAPESDLDRTLTLAAALGLGQLAWILWHEREPTDPLLMLERFASLDGRVQFRPDSVRVVLPQGRRGWDLSAQRLLDDVHGLPWLGGRVVTFHLG